MTSHAQRMFDSTARVEMMWWLPGIACQPPQEFKDFIENDLPDEKELLKQLPWIKKFLDQKDWQLRAEEWPAEFHRKGCDGYLVQLATPIPKGFSEDGRSWSYSWGHYQTQWFYFDTLDELVQRAEQFAKDVQARERAKSKKKVKEKV